MLIEMKSNQDTPTKRKTKTIVMTTADKKCHLCQKALQFAKEPRKNNYLTGSCLDCKWQHLFFVQSDGQINLSWIQKRQMICEVLWHVSYHLGRNETKFTKVKKQAKSTETSPASEE